jgi:hypothetical protein
MQCPKFFIPSSSSSSSSFEEAAFFDFIGLEGLFDQRQTRSH